MFANIHNLQNFLSGVKLLLDNDGIFIIQTGYHPYQFSKNMFDYIYHEHFSYFTLKTLSYLLNDFELEIVDAKILKPKGGSIRVFVKNKSIKNLQSDRLKNLIYEEKKHKYNSHHIFTLLNENISKERDKLITQLEVLKKDNITIAGIGASHSTTTLIFHFQMYRYIDFLIDDNPKKHNTYSPGLHIKVFKKNYLINKKIRHIVILAWQHQDTIITKYKSFLNREGTIFVPLPKFKVIKKHKP